MVTSDPSRSGARAAGRCVLCVDDDPSISRLLARRLSHLGYGAATASCAAEALEVLASARIDAMITDYRMPGANGLELARAAVEKCPTLVVFLLTGLAEAPSSDALRESGIAQVLAKPVVFDELATKLERELSERSDSDTKRSA